MAKRRKSGTGSVHLRKDGRWEGRIVIGYDEEGLPKTKNVLAHTKSACVKKLKELGRVRENTRYILSHFAHFGLIYDEIVRACVEIYRQTGIFLEVAYDGFTAEF